MDETTPVACTLTSADLAAQGERWERLIARAMTERAETADGLTRLTAILACQTVTVAPFTYVSARALHRCDG